MKMKIVLLSLLALLAVFNPAQAEDHAYVLLYTDQEKSLNDQSVKKLVANNVRLIGHMKIVDGSLPSDNIKPPIAASLFVGSDVDYVNFLSNSSAFEATILRGTIDQKGGLAYLEKSPMAAIVLSPNVSSAPENSLTIDISHRLIKDEAEAHFYSPISHVSIHPISFDDNPMEFMPDTNTKGTMGLVGEFQR